MNVVQSKVREYIKKSDKDMRLSPDFMKALSGAVEKMVKEAISRAKKNKRKTLRDYDL